VTAFGTGGPGLGLSRSSAARPRRAGKAQRLQTQPSPVQTPAKHEPLAHRVPFASGVGALHKPLAGSQVRFAWQLVDGHATLPAAHRSVGRECG
jgi:hypothetical protein